MPAPDVLWDWDYAFSVLPTLLRALVTTIEITALGSVLALVLGLAQVFYGWLLISNVASTISAQWRVARSASAKQRATNAARSAAGLCRSSLAAARKSASILSRSARYRASRVG